MNAINSEPSDRESPLSAFSTRPRYLWAAWSDPQHLKHWWGPSGLPIHSMSSIFGRAEAGVLSCVAERMDFENNNLFVEITKPD